MDKNVLPYYPILKKLNSVYSTYNPFKYYSPYLCLYSRWLPYQNSEHISLFFLFSLLNYVSIRYICLMMTTLRILRNGSINHKVPCYVIPSNGSITLLVPNTFITILFGSACNLCYSGNIALCTFAHIKQWRRLVLTLASASF